MNFVKFFLTYLCKYVASRAMLKSFVVSILLVLTLSFEAAASSPTIRVRIADGVPSISVYGKEVAIINDAGRGEEIKINERAVISAGKSSLLINGKDTALQKIKLVSRDGLIWINGKSYAGDVTIEKTWAAKTTAVNTLPLEKYMTGILAGEMPTSWPAEALKAQAVTARTYALYVMNERNQTGANASFDIKSTVEDQVYSGSPHVNQKVADAVRLTEGEILTFHNKPVKTRFHSTCGGQTETSIHVWGENDVSKRTDDPYCKNSPYRNWQVTLSSGELSSALQNNGFDPGYIKSLGVELHNDSGRVAAVLIGGSKQTISLTGNDFRRCVGFGKIKSTLFTVVQKGNRFVFTGKGFGHGVGMCQWGAKGMAEKGLSYKDILNFYYPGTEIKKVY
jgi:stage II sporulation protein D